MSGFMLGGARRVAIAVCIAALLTGTTAIESAFSAQGGAPPGAAAAKKKKKKKKCKRGYKRVTVKVKRKRHGKRVTVKVKKCRKAKKRKSSKPVAGDPRIDEVLGWSTVAQNPDTPPADLVADGGTITNCTTPNALSVYVRRSGFTSVGLVSHVWKRDGAVVASGTNSSTYNGAFRHGLTFSPMNGVYEITWSSGGRTIRTARVTRSC